MRIARTTNIVLFGLVIVGDDTGYSTEHWSRFQRRASPSSVPNMIMKNKQKIYPRKEVAIALDLLHPDAYLTQHQQPMIYMNGNCRWKTNLQSAIDPTILHQIPSRNTLLISPSPSFPSSTSYAGTSTSTTTLDIFSQIQPHVSQQDPFPSYAEGYLLQDLKVDLRLL